MLGLIHNQVVEVEPVLEVLPEQFAFRASKPDSSGKGRLYLYLDGRIVEMGRVFFVMEKEGDVQLDRMSGHFRMGRNSSALFRCVFGGQHLEMEMKR